MIVLQPFTKNDFALLTSWIDSEELLTNWAGSLFRYPLNNESLDWYVDDTNNLATSDAFVYKAVDDSTGLTVGHISLGAVSRKNRSGRISRVLIGSYAARGRGYCQQMITAILKFGFEELNLHRISLGVYVNNVSAINCYLKAGFIVEGTSRDVLWFNNAFLSLIEMSMLKPEWNKRGKLASTTLSSSTNGHNLACF